MANSTHNDNLVHQYKMTTRFNLPGHFLLMMKYRLHQQTPPIQQFQAQQLNS